MVAICSHRVVSAPTCNSLEILRIAQLKGELPFQYAVNLFIGDALISRSRSQACSKFLESTTIPYMLFIDDDIIFNPEDVTKIYKFLSSGKYHVIGGIYPVRGASQLSSYSWGGKLAIDGKVHDIEYLATGFMGISRKVLEKVRDELKLPILNPNDWARCWPFFECGRWTDRKKGGDPIYISEDWDFSEKARAVGEKIYADTSIQLGHIREEVFTPEHVLRVQMQADLNKRVYHAANHHSELIKSVDTDLSEFLAVPLKTVQHRIRQSTPLLAKAWVDHKGSADDFYKTSDMLLYDNASFNYQNRYFQERIGALVNICGAKVLDVGCGIGTTVFMLAEQENETLGWDISPKCIEFCNWKKKKYDLKGEFTGEEPDYSKFNLVTAVDVLEHIEDLEGFLMRLGKGLSHGAKFYHSDFFARRDSITNTIVWPMHFEENAEHLSEWLKNAGFVEWDGQWAVRA